MPYNRAIRLFHCLVTPIALYACEYWLPCSLTKKSLESTKNLLQSWESFRGEVIHQKMCRLILSVMKNTSRLATLGELGQYPLWNKALSLVLKYDWHLNNKISRDTISHSVVTEMKDMDSRGVDCWLTRVNKIKSLLNFKQLPSHLSQNSISNKTSKSVNSLFDRFWLDSINKVQKNGCNCPRDHNKLRFYKQFKGSFSVEPYLELVRNRNQRSFLTRFRVSSHRLRVETGRWTVPKTVYEDRICLYCDSGSVDSELHFITQCKLAEQNRNSLYIIMDSIDSNFKHLSDEAKLVYLLCPVDSLRAKLCNKYLGLLVKTRTFVDQGIPLSNVGILCLDNQGIQLVYAN